MYKKQNTGRKSRSGKGRRFVLSIFELVSSLAAHLIGTHRRSSARTHRRSRSAKRECPRTWTRNTGLSFSRGRFRRGNIDEGSTRRNVPSRGRERGGIPTRSRCRPGSSVRISLVELSAYPTRKRQRERVRRGNERGEKSKSCASE